ncbi:MAG: nucleoside-diphosphate sugar epimerase/dehydratase, partial [Trueperaceae bacterium]|nr:nucleoside-diphosphate sugar epimerase/dehydratase [Trueperaceae bacterium]
MTNLATRLRRRLQAPHKIAVDLFLWVAATPVAFLLRFDGTFPARYVEAAALYALLGLVFKAVALFAFRLNQRSWRKVTFRDVSVLTLAIGIVAGLELAAVYLLRPGLVVPASIPLIEGVLALLALFAVRAALRGLDERRRRVRPDRAQAVLVVGAGEAGSFLVREMLRHPEMGLEPVALVDDDPAKQRVRIGGVPVLGTRADLPRLLRETPVQQVLVAIPTAEGSLIRETLQQVRDASEAAGRTIDTRVVPGMFELLSGDVSVDRIRPVRVEDLLRRPPVQLDTDSIAQYVKGKRVLVTGAGGSIGSEIARQLARFEPGELLLLGRGETSMFEIDKELARTHPDVPRRTLIATVRERDRLAVLFDRHAPQVVFHAAAHKHVPLMEAHPEEAVLNNVAGTRHVVDLALAHDVEAFVNVSTDKAVNPTSVMGASKRLAECLVQDAALRAAPGRRYVSVRFGNVLGSRGSVVPLFQEQIRAGGPVTVTDARMTRYFMTIPEASQLVLQAGALAENGAVYVLDMGEPVRIVDLAEDLIRLSGLEPYEDVEIRETGIRPGEKLYEELLGEGETTGEKLFENIFVGQGQTFVGEPLRAYV